MGREQPSIGQGAEWLAGDYLRGSFVDWAFWQNGASKDLVCKGLRIERNSSVLYEHPTLEFYFQVKGAPDAFAVPINTFRSWVRTCATRPIMLLALERLGSKAQRWRYLSLHDWLLSESAQEPLERKVAPKFSPKMDFVVSDYSDQNFHTVLLKEAQRATRSVESPWSTLQDYGLLPFDESAFLEWLDFTSHAEVPVKVYEELKKLNSTVPEVMRRLLEGNIETDGLVREWLDQIKRRVSGHTTTSLQRREFARFVRAMRAWHAQNELPKFPPFQASFVGVWRVFSAMYPQSIDMYHAVIRHSQSTRDVQFAAAMVSMLANAKDRETETRVCDALRALESRRSDSPAYSYRRELFRAPAEAGDRKAAQTITDFVTRPERLSAELEFLDGYGWKADQLEANLSRKLERPVARDQNLRLLYEGMADALL